MKWSSWLESGECLPVLLRAAVRVVRAVPRYGIPRAVLPGGGLRESSREGDGACVQELANELWIFARDQAAAWDESSCLETLRAQGADRVALFIAGRYVNRLRDEVRTKRTDPHRALYRRVRQCLQSEPSIRTKAERAGSFFALDEGDLPEADLARLTQNPYRDWPPPSVEGGEASSLRHAALVQAARFFWQEARTRLGRPCWVPVRELTRYLMCHLEVGPAPTKISLAERTPEEEAGPATDRDLPMEPTQEHELTAARLPELARTLTAGWSGREKEAFYARYGREMSLAAVARELGYGGPSGVKYLLANLENRLADFCLLWPGLSPPDVDKTLWAAFVEEVVRACKEGDRSRKDNVKENRE